MLLCCMKTIKDVFLDFHDALDELYGAQEAEAITLMVLSEITGMSKAKIKAFPEARVPFEALQKLSAIVTELKTGKPLQYILGSTEFYGLPFLVSPAVLIPRPETEELVDWVLSVCRDQVTFSNQALSILDIGTGSGCIAISLKKNLPAAEVSALDVSAEALKVARQNAVVNDVDVSFMQRDILQADLSQTVGNYTIIISNPPYVTLTDKAAMHTNVTDFEPHTALFVPQDDPLLFYRTIADYALQNLVANGVLFFEINEAFGQKTVELLADKGFNNIELRKDLSGRDRMIKANR